MHMKMAYKYTNKRTNERTNERTKERKNERTKERTNEKPNKNQTYIGCSCVCLQGWSGVSSHCSTQTSTDFRCMPGYHGDMCLTSDCGTHGYPKHVDNKTDEFM